MRLGTTLALGIAGWLLACGPSNVQKVQPEMRVRNGTAELAEGAAIDMGGTPVLNTAEVTLTIMNVGLGDLHLTGATLALDSSTPDGSFAVKEPRPQKVPQGQSLPLVVQFIPQAQGGPFGAELTLTSDDHKRPTVHLKLSGTGTTVAAIEVAPTTLDFGVVGEGTRKVKKVRVTSTGTADLIIQSLAFKDGSDPAFVFVGSTQTPAILKAPGGGDPGESVDIALAFSPAAATPRNATATLVIGSTDPGNRAFEVTLSGVTNHAPIPNSGGDRDAAPLDVVTLDGGLSTDPDGDLPLAWDWTLVAQPANSQTVLSGPGTQKPTLQLDLAGEYVVSLGVIDSLGLPSVKPSLARIRAIPADKLYAELVWTDPVTDLDLHLFNDGASVKNDWGNKNDCFYLNPHPDWGNPGDTRDDPVLRRDDLAGFGPEIIAYPSPPAGTFTFAVQYFASHGYGAAVQPTVRIYSYGVLAAEFSHPLDKPGQIWTVATVSWPSGTVSKVDLVTGP